MYQKLDGQLLRKKRTLDTYLIAAGIAALVFAGTVLYFVTWAHPVS